MALKIYYPEDLVHILQGVNMANVRAMTIAVCAAKGSKKELLQMYRQGYRDALIAAGLAFGLRVNVPALAHELPQLPASETLITPVQVVQQAWIGEEEELT